VYSIEQWLIFIVLISTGEAASRVILLFDTLAKAVLYFQIKAFYFKVFNFDFLFKGVVQHIHIQINIVRLNIPDRIIEFKSLKF